MTEYKIVYRNKDGIYQIIDSIYSEDTAYMVLFMLIKLGYEDCRIELHDKEINACDSTV